MWVTQSPFMCCIINPIIIHTAPPISYLGPWQIEWLTCIPHSQVLHGLALSGCWWQPSPSLPCHLFCCACQHFDRVEEGKVHRLPPVWEKSPLKAFHHAWPRLQTCRRGKSGHKLKNIWIVGLARDSRIARGKSECLGMKIYIEATRLIHTAKSTSNIGYKHKGKAAKAKPGRACP